MKKGFLLFGFLLTILALLLLKIISTSKTGILSIGGECMIPEGCGPEISLTYLQKDKYIPLQGNISDTDDGLLVQAFGYEFDWNYPLFALGSYKKIKAFNVIWYRKLSKIHFPSFLITESTKHIAEKYGCTCIGPGNCKFPHTKIFSWEMNNQISLFKVKWDQTNGNFIELVYDGNSGELVQETVYPENAQFCKN